MKSIKIVVMDNLHLKYFLILLFLCCARAINHELCLKGLQTDGFTVPVGDIVLEYGQPLNITCNIYEDIAKQYGENASSHLFFYRDNQAIPREMIEIINSTSIRLYIEKPGKVSSETYFCYFNNEPTAVLQKNSRRDVCMNVVIVGVAPQPVTDFSCVARNLDNLTCSWTEPENYIHTTYELTYVFNGRLAKNNHFSCPSVQTTYDYENKIKRGSCFWNTSTTPQYRQVQKVYNFTLEMKNKFGKRSLEYVFDHFKNIIPNPPENLTAVATSPNSVNLSWAIPPSMRGFSCGLHHRILYQCVYSGLIWHHGGLILNATSNATLHFELDSLKYAHDLCDIRVSMRSGAADIMWSENASTTVLTKSKIPDCPPTTTGGSFEIVSEYNSVLDVYVYWRMIETSQENGEKFSYVVSMDDRPDVQYVELTNNYARFSNLSVTGSDYVVNIWSKNTEGLSIRKSTVVIPASRPPPPRNFIRLEHTEFIELKWEPPTYSDVEITNYTLFWCDNDRERPHQCKGRFMWTTVPKNETKYTMPVSLNDIYQFAISSNSHSGSSGMQWAGCTFLANSAVGQMRSVWVNKVDSKFIELGWTIECADKIQTVAGYVIYCCPMVSTEKKECNGSEEILTINDNSVHAAKVDNLKPYTMCRLRVGVIMGPGVQSRLSDFLINSTNEDAPSAPVDVTVINKTNCSVTLTWLPPTESNGKLRDYYIHYSDDAPAKKVGSDVNTTTLTDLESYKNYTITVRACTVRCSRHSRKQTVQTNMWLPGEIDQPRVFSQNDSVTTIDWKLPSPPRGPIDYYQLRFMRDKSQNDSLEAMVNVSSTQNYSIEECGQSGRYNKVLVSVRGVNIIDGVHAHGPWSRTLEAQCTHTSELYVILCVIVVFVFLCAAGIFGFRKMYACCKSMQDVDVKLPPGLAPVMEQHDLVPWASEKTPSLIDRSSRPDQELLLKKLPDLRVTDDTREGSSGHESITSSVETNTSPSTDSGTEQDVNLGDENRKNSLGQRNVSCKGYVVPESAQTNVNWGGKTAAPAGDCCVLGVDPSEVDSPYLPMNDNGSTMSLPYVSCEPQKPHGDLVKTPNPGYIASEPTSKNTGYVVAGLTKDVFVPETRHGGAATIDNTPYLKMEAPVTPKAVQLAWHQPVLEPTKAGYVTVGDAPQPPKALKDASKGYVPHRQFEAKTLKED